MLLSQSVIVLYELAFAEALHPCLIHTSRPQPTTYTCSQLTHMVPLNPLVLTCLATFVFPSTWNARLHFICLEYFYIAFKAISNGTSSVKPSQTSQTPWELSKHLSSGLL